MGAVITRLRAVFSPKYQARVVNPDGIGIALSLRREDFGTVQTAWRHFRQARGDKRYNGSYALLTSFLESCHASGMPESTYQELIEALRDLSARSLRKKVDISEGLFADTDEQRSAYLLSSLGIATNFQEEVQQRFSAKPHVTQEMMMELFKERIMEHGQLMQKTKAALIRPAKRGEKITTLVNGVVTSESVVQDATSWVVRAPTANQEEYILTKEKFENYWVFDKPENISTPEEADAGFKRYNPRASPKWLYKILQEDVAALPSNFFKSSWGALQPILINDYLVMPYPEVKASEIYLMPAEAVNSTYTKIDVRESVKDEVAEITAILRTLSFDIDHKGNLTVDIKVMTNAFSDPFDLLYRYQIDTSVFAGWLTAIAEQYRANPYHNWRHAFDVFQFMYGALTEGDSSGYFRFQDMLALLLAAVGHDVGHVGYTNPCLISSQHELAITYNDKSPLEFMHASVFFQTLRKPGLNFLSNMSTENFKAFRHKVIEAILATDFDHHFEMVDKLSVLVSQTDLTASMESESELKKQQSEEMIMLQSFMHMADLGHCCIPFTIHKFLVARLEEEYFLQGDHSREIGIPVMPMMDRTKDSAAAGQNFFLSKLVQPLLKQYSFFMSDERREALRQNLQNNCKEWEAWVVKYGKATTAQKMLELEGFDLSTVRPWAMQAMQLQRSTSSLTSPKSPRCLLPSPSHKW